MTTPCTRTLRLLARRQARLFWGLAGVLLLLGLWLAWFVAGDLAVHAVGTARLEADRRPHRLMISVPGQVSEIPGEHAASVRAGQVLVALDDAGLQGLLTRERAELSASEQTGVGVGSADCWGAHAFAAVASLIGLGDGEQRSRERQSVAASRDAEAEVERLHPLVDLGILGRADLQRTEVS